MVVTRAESRRIELFNAIAQEESSTTGEPLPKRARFASGVLTIESEREGCSTDFTVPYRPIGFYILWLLRPTPVGRSLSLRGCLDDLPALFCKPSKDLD